MTDPRAQSTVQRPTGPPPSEGPPITVVVATRDRPALLAGALGALKGSLRPGDRAIVVDSASVDRRVRDVAEAAEVDLVVCERPGACRARNAGLHAATTDIVAFTDDDCRPGPGWVAALASAFAGAPGLDFVTGQVLSDAPAGGRAQLALSVLESSVAVSFGAGDEPSGMGHGANMAWRKAALEAIGGFDETLGPGAPLHAAEDHDVFWRALSNGAAGRFDPSAVVVHHQWRSRRGQLTAYYGYGVGTGAIEVKRRRVVGGTFGAARGVLAPPLGIGRTASLVTGRLLWHDGIGAIARNLASGYEMGALAEGMKLAGALRGVLLSRRMALVDGRFVDVG